VWSFLAPAPEPGLQPGPVPTFSVVIPAYQAADSVGHAVESALSQTVRPLEVIVVDDGSTDGIEEALRPYSGRITLLSKENGGRASARNLGVAHAQGELVSFLDADDVYEHARLEALGRLAAERPDLGVLMTDATLEVEGRVVGRFCAETPFAVDDQRLAILDRCFVVCPCVRRSRLVDAGGFDEAIPMGEDWECWIRLIMRGVQVGLVDAPLYRYRIRTSDADRVSSLRERVRVLEKVSVTAELSQEERDVLERSFSRTRQRALLAEAESALRNGDKTARRRSLAVALGPGFGLRTRLKALAAAVSPRAAGTRLAAREEETGWSRLQRGYPRG
jgi:glycosyltransferase involved in cell wall biosynthesis